MPHPANSLVFVRFSTRVFWNDYEKHTQQKAQCARGFAGEAGKKNRGRLTEAANEKGRRGRVINGLLPQEFLEGLLIIQSRAVAGSS